MTKMTIALVDDDDLIRENYSVLLSEEGYQVRVYADRADAYRSIVFEPPDLAIIDIGLDRERNGGFELCREIRKHSRNLPIMFLTSNSSNDARIEGYECDVDGYIVKGESLDLFVVRIASLFRRLHSLSNVDNKKNNCIERGDLMLDIDASTLYWKAQRVKLTLTQFCIAKELAIRPREIKSIPNLMSTANIVVEPNTIVSNIKIIRTRFREIDPSFNCIKAEYSLGYKWNDSKI